MCSLAESNELVILSNLLNVYMQGMKICRAAYSVPVASHAWYTLVIKCVTFVGSATCFGKVLQGWAGMGMDSTVEMLGSL